MPLLPGLSIEVVQTLDSTNSGAHRTPAQRLQRAEGAGRPPWRTGRRPVPATARGHQPDRGPRAAWAVAGTPTPGASLTFSLALPLRAGRLVGAVAGRRAGGGRGAGTRRASARGSKWPNDLDLSRRRRPRAPLPAPTKRRGESGVDKAPRSGRKLGGILIESVAVGDQRAAVIGIGINVTSRILWPRPTTARPRWPRSGRRPRRRRRWRASPSRWCARWSAPFERDGFAPLQEGYARRDVLRGQLAPDDRPRDARRRRRRRSTRMAP